MLKKFSVTNFKNFRNQVVFDLASPANYEFNTEIIRNGIVSKGILFGINGSGKSNFGLALFDITLHLTDHEKSLDHYELYANLSSPDSLVKFEYVFSFDGLDVTYRYGKTDALTLVYESLTVGKEEVLHYDFSGQQGFVSLKGAETLKLTSSLAPDQDRLSRVKYVKSNAILADTPENRAFLSFISFVDRMLMFYSLDQNRYQGLRSGRDSYTQGIIRAGMVREFEDFLRKQSLDYHLVEVNENGHRELYCQYPDCLVPFTRVASTGTRSLALFYYWFIQMEKASFVYIDEYDAFYHFELATFLVEQLKRFTQTQIFLSSHNTDLLSNDLLRPDAYFEIENGTITSFNNLSDKELRRAHNIQKMYKAGSFHA